MALGSAQPLIGMSIRDISWGGLTRPVRRADKLLSCTDCLQIWEPQPPGTLRACSRPVQELLFIINFQLYYDTPCDCVCRNTVDDLQVWKPWIVLTEAVLELCLDGRFECCCKRNSATVWKCSRTVRSSEGIPLLAGDRTTTVPTCTSSTQVIWRCRFTYMIRNIYFTKFQPLLRFGILFGGGEEGGS